MSFRNVLTKLCLSSFIAVVVAMASVNNALAELPAVSPEGLRLLPNTELAAVYMREDADFSGYTEVAILDCYVAFRKNWKRDQNSYMLKVSDNDMTRIKGEVAERLKKVFGEKLKSTGMELTGDAGDDVLVLRPAIINLDVAAPDTMRPGPRSFSASAGAMTLYLEVYDSVTGDLLARVIDREQATDYGRFQIRNGVTNRADADRILEKWASTLANYLQSARSSGTH